MQELHAAQRVAAHQAVPEATGRLAGVIQSLPDEERSERLLDAAEVVAIAVVDGKPTVTLQAALVKYLAGGQAWLQDLMAEDAR